MNRLTRILPIAAGLLCTLLYGCGQEATAPSIPQFAVAPQPVETELTECRPMPQATSSAVIGPKGGKIKAGAHMLYVPPGALSTPTQITLVALKGTINRVSLAPEGLAFDVRYPARLVTSYANCYVSSQQQIVHVDEQLTILGTTPSSVDPVARTVDGKVLHISDYALSTYAVVY